MLKITIQGDEFWDEEAEKFCYSEDIVLKFEHSLVSLSKWEGRFHKLFLTKTQKTEEEMVGYIESMLITPDVDLSVLDRLTEEHVHAINDYINDPMTGSTLSNVMDEGPKSSEQLSSELIYFWMSQYQIDKECERWHLNRLFMLIRIHHAKSQKPKKMSKQARVQSMAEINAQRKSKLGTTG